MLFQPMLSFTGLLLFLSVSSTANTDTCPSPPPSQSLIRVLANISNQLGSVKSVGDSLNSVTNLLHVSLLKELLDNGKGEGNNNEGLAILKRMESILNESCSADELKELQSQVSSIESTVSSMQSSIELLLERTNATYELIKGNKTYDVVHYNSCEAILNKLPNSPSGYYSLVDVNGTTHQVYCHMETLCGKGGGWRRIASLNMTDPNEKCPTQFRLYSQGGVRACGRPVTSSGSCVGITFPSRDIKYSQVCGKVIGYQYNSPDGASAYSSSKDINSPYIDGIILTHGSPRKHIWSLISGYSDVGANRCPCGSNDPKTVPSFVDSDYYCESGCHTSIAERGSTLYSTDPLWDGKGCGSSETTCCKRPLIPWFYKSLTYSTADSVEMRICCDQDTVDEDVLIEQYEIYVK